MSGLKYDGGKPRWSLLMNGCALALQGVVAVLTFGAKKYAADSWQGVENAEERYRDALYRHLASIEQYGLLSVDDESGLLHIYHVATNALFLSHFATKRATKDAANETR
jgi:Domain of unknown function (DUF5664)